jgi:hypothetical protein
MSMNRQPAPNNQSPRPRRPVPVFAILFLIVLCLPLLKSIMSPAANYALRDQKAKAASAVAGSGETPGSFRAWNEYANERFAGRDILIHLNNLVQVRLLKVSPLETLMVGRDGWLFLAGSNLEMDYFRAAMPFSEDELARWRRVLLQRHIWLQRLGIRFVFVIAPNKSTIYPEKVPARIHRAATRLDQLLDYLQRRPLPRGFRLVDLRKTLRAAKSRFPVYGNIDSHWNSYGAMLAANKILQALSRFYPLHSPTGDEFMVSLAPGSGTRGDLAAMLSLSDVLIESLAVKVRSARSPRALTLEADHWLDEYFERGVTTCSAAELPEALMFRDSFGYALGEFLSEHFRKITYLRDIGLRFHPRIVREVRPKIVIQEMAERFFQVVAPFNEPELDAIDVDRKN